MMEIFNKTMALTILFVLIGNFYEVASARDVREPRKTRRSETAVGRSFDDQYSLSSTDDQERIVKLISGLTMQNNESLSLLKDFETLYKHFNYVRRKVDVKQSRRFRREFRRFRHTYSRELKQRLLNTTLKFGNGTEKLCMAFIYLKKETLLLASIRKLQRNYTFEVHSNLTLIPTLDEVGLDMPSRSYGTPNLVNKIKNLMSNESFHSCKKVKSDMFSKDSQKPVRSKSLGRFDIYFRSHNKLVKVRWLVNSARKRVMKYQAKLTRV